MAKTELKICMGTMCYVMGGAEIRAIIERLPENISRNISISYSPCLGMCDKEGKPPYVELNGKIIGGISKTNMLNILKEAEKDVVR